MATTITLLSLRRAGLAASSESGTAASQLLWRRGTAGGVHASGEGGENSTRDHATSSSNLLKSLLRVDLLAEEAATALAHGRSAASGRRPDLAAARDEEAEHLAEVQRMVPQHGVRPSALSPATKAAFSLLGSAAALMPRSLSGAISAGVQDALTDTYNEQLRQLREAGVAEEVPDVRAMIRRLRDIERAPEGAPRAPDITDVRRLSELSPQEGVAAAVKVGTKLMLELAQKL